MAKGLFFHFQHKMGSKDFFISKLHFFAIVIRCIVACLQDDFSMQCKLPTAVYISVQVAEAGFYYINGTEDTTVCVVCQKELEGWEEEDSPL